ncbi:MAG: tetratricopeptide repeat protein, partial [Phycisphaerae bacterium]|nr:tetratricopeptide repeat protein [Phycisphaerae bacterium]
AAGDDGALVAIVMVVILVLAMLAGLFLLGAYMSRRTARRMMVQVQAQAAAQQGLVASPQVAALVDQGVALMSQFEPAKAEALFAQAALLEPGFVTNLNQAIALLNRSEPDSQERAIVMLQAIVSTNQANPEIARAFYCLGLAHSYLGRPDQALQHFQRASSLRPDDAAAHYQVALALEQLDRLDEALAEYEMAHEHDPLLRSALLGIQRTQARLGNEQAAAQALERFVALENNPRARLTEFKYTRMGPLSEAIPAVGARNSPTGPNFGPPLTSTQGQATSNPLVGEPLLAPASDSAPRFGAGTPVPIDFDGDGLTDLFVPGGAGADGRSLLLRQNDTGSYARVENDLASMPSVRFVAFADYENDGRTDALVVTREPAASRLMRRAEDGSFAETMRWEESRDALWADLDHDGDLDLVLARIGTTPLVLMNRGAEGFEALDRRSGLIDTPSDCTGLAVGDLDGDSQLDLAFLTASDSQIWINDGFWHWRRSAELAALERNSSERMVIAEDPVTGDPLVVSMTPSAAPGAPVPPAPPAPGTAPARFLKPWVRRGVPSGRAWYSFATIAVDADSHFELVDLLGNGTRQLLVGEPQRTRLVGLDGSTMLDLPVPAGSRCAVVANGTDPQPVIAAWSAAGPMILRRPVGGPWQPVVAVDFRGRIDPSTNMRSNADGIGTRWSSRVDDRWNGGWVLRTTSGPGQGRQPVFIGLGSSAKSLGALFIDWPDGVIQSEMSLAPGTRHTITETQRQISSCPVIFAWDGERFAFETDCLGVGGLGYLVGADRDEAGRVRPLRAPPRPRESVPLRGPIRERDGAFELRLTEPMEEACYLDAARLIEWRVPAGWECVLDERMAINGPEPTGEMRFYRESMEPASASLSNRFGAWAPKEQSSNAAARERMTVRDHRAVEFGSPDPRFIGRLREQGTLTLTFPRELDSRGGRPAL